MYLCVFSKVVLLWDNDGLEVKSDKILLRSLEVLKNGGRRTYLLVPPLLQVRLSIICFPLKKSLTYF